MGTNTGIVVTSMHRLVVIPLLLSPCALLFIASSGCTLKPSTYTLNTGLRDYQTQMP